MTWRPPKIMELELLTYEEKIRRWGEDDEPWKPAEGRYKFSKHKTKISRTVMQEGDITRIEPTLALPCLGIITAYLRYRDALKYVKGAGMQPASRCHTCNARQICGNIVRRRIEAYPGLKAAYEGWMIADGPSEINKSGWRDRSAGWHWKKLTRTAAAHPFTSVNDAYVATYYAQRIEAEAAKERDRQRRIREQKRRGGELDAAHEADLTRAMTRRAQRLVVAILDARTTDHNRALSRLPTQSVRELLEVWLGRELLLARKLTPTAAAIARWIVSEGKCNTSGSQAALEVRVRKDLKRIKEFEELEWNGEPILHPFNAATEFAS